MSAISQMTSSRSYGRTTQGTINTLGILVTGIIVPLPRSSAGFAFMLIVMDCFSKFSLVFALRKATAKEIIKKVEDPVFLLFGIPKILIAYNGTQCKSQEFQSFSNTYRFVIRFSAHHHRQANPTARVKRI